jgi:microcystin-dependent protein
MPHPIFCTGKLPVLHFKPLIYMKKTLFFFLLVVMVYQPAQAQVMGLVGEIRLFAGNFAPQGWAICDGSMFSTDRYNALFAVLGNKYGGDGKTTFALPDLRGKVPMGVSAAEVGKQVTPPFAIKKTQYSMQGTVIVQENAPPTLALHYIICIEGSFPQKN